MNKKPKLLLAGCTCIAVLSQSISAAFGQNQACCLPNGTCANATVLSCTIDLGGTPMGVGSACQGDNNGDGFDDLCVSPILISEYYESAPGFRKCIELFNPGTVPFDLGANGYRIAAYRQTCVDTGNSEADARGIYTFGTLGIEVVPGGGVFVICESDFLDPNFTPDLLLPDPCIPCNYTGGGCGVGVKSPMATFNGDDAIVLFGTDIASTFDNVVDSFALPFEGGAGPRGATPYKDAAWERKFSVTGGVRDLLGFDSCNFDGLKDGTTTPTPPGTPANATCLAALDISTSNQWIFEGLNPSGDSQNHTLGSHVPDAAPIASNIQAITKLNTGIQLTLAVIDIDGDAFNTIVDTLPSVGTIWDGDPAMGGININLAGVPYTMTNSFVTFVPDAGVGTDASFDYHGEQITPIQIGNTAAGTILVEDEGVLITEILFNPNAAQPESQWEWAEIINNTGSTVTLGEINNTNCTVCGDNLLVGGAGGTPTSIGPGEIKVIVGNITTTNPRTDQEFLDLWGLSASQVLFVDATSGIFPFLTNSGTQLFLKDANGDLIDFVDNYGNAPFPAGVPGSSIFLTDTTLDNTDGTNWAVTVADCLTGAREVGDTSIGSPGAVPGAATSVLPPCAFAGLDFALAGAPTTKTVTLQGALGGNAPAGATLGFRITKLPFLDANGLELGAGELHDGPTAGGTLLTVGSVVTDSMGRVTLVEPAGFRHFINFQFKAIEKLSGGGTGAESSAATSSIAVQSNTVVITEIMANPTNTSGGSETYWEYLEVSNRSGSPVTLGSMQATNGVTSNGANLLGVANVTIPANTTRIIARDALDGSTDPVAGVRTRAEFLAEWSTASLSSTDVIYVPNTSGPGGNLWDGLSNNPLAPGRFVTVWDDSNNFELDGLLDVVVYQIGQNGWPVNTQPNSIFYRGDSNGAPFTTLGNDTAASWQESTSGCAGDGSFDSFADIIGGDTTVDHGSPLALPTNPDQCVPAPCATCVGDMSGDGVLDGRDIQQFVNVVINPGFPLIGCADVNGDGNALDYLPDVPLFVDALVFGSTDCTGFVTTHRTSVTIDLLGAPVAGDVELFIGGCDPTLPCNTLATPSFICFERVTVTPATTAVQLAEELAFGLDRVKDGIGGLDEFCLPDGADVNVAGSAISIVFTRAAGLVVPCCYVQDTDGTFSNVSPFDFMLIGGAGDCVVTNLANGVAGDEAGPDGASGFKFSKTGM